jgi:hypothetical protein
MPTSLKWSPLSIFSDSKCVMVVNLCICTYLEICCQLLDFMPWCCVTF